MPPPPPPPGDGLLMPPLLPCGDHNWPLTDGPGSPFSEDAFSVVDDLDDEERAKIIQDFYEGDKTCQCCINWVEGLPQGVQDEDNDSEDEDEGPPIIIRRKRTGGGANPFSIHAVEIRNKELRKILVDVFKGFDGLWPGLRYLTFLAPFRQFYYRWNGFEEAIEGCDDDALVKGLQVLRGIIKSQLKSTFTISKEMIANGVVTIDYLWTLFRPGDVAYMQDDNGNDQALYVKSVQAHPWNFQLTCQYLDFDGRRFGYVDSSVQIPHFTGTKQITELNIYPLHHHKDVQNMKERLVMRGERFREFTGVHYKSYREHCNLVSMKSLTRQVDRRIIIDAESHPDSRKRPLGYLEKPEHIPLSTGLIRQSPAVSIPPPDGHIPLPLPGQRKMQSLPPPADCYNPHMPAPFGVGKRKKGRHYNTGMSPMPPMPPIVDTFISAGETAEEALERQKESLTPEFHLLICTPTVRGFCLREQEWEDFNIDGVEEVEFNTAPFDSLVLPEGYKELILAFVESQLKEGDSFEDVINGKGGGLVVLLSGVPGVGKTLTAESVAERIHAPLFKLELREEESTTKRDRSDSEDVYTTHNLDEQFRWAAKWGAVLLIDECDTYLQTRSDQDSRRNRLVQTFLQKLEYYPSLLFLTTNRPGTLDPALQSRIHLTINYPALDPASRLTIWRNFLMRQAAHSSTTATVSGNTLGKYRPRITEEEIRILAGLGLDGRRIKNLVKSAGIMARREGRGVEMDDLRKVLRITEGVEL
ncbi:hypothetical protein FKW77_001155 [Venturia effusa]|uniref:AAA+ ATPase domain-containing protein n=1 Tax=Venturia effusa TaxID=50376 RepID=A0A517LES8_9PEZI|nr:hypothetical protein FKW77_001155 [Venturia effusa]